MGFQREMQRASLQSFSSYSPTAQTRITGRMPQPTSSSIQVVPVGEERLNVATRTVTGETTRVRRRVVEQPVEQQVTLRDEKVIVERRLPVGGSAPRPDMLTETVIEMSDSRQVPTVWKSLHVAEEVVLRKQVTERTERVRDTVRRDVVDVEHARETIVAPVAELSAQTAGAARDQLAAIRHAADADQREQRADAPAAQSLDKAPGERGTVEEAADKKPQASAVVPGGRKG